jgi:hypothetical protein
MIVYSRGRTGSNQATALLIDAHFEPKTIARHHVPAKLRVIDASKRHPTTRNQERRHLRHRLDHQHRRHQRRAGKVPLKKLFADGDVLHGHNPAPRLVLDDVVYEK